MDIGGIHGRLLALTTFSVASTPETSLTKRCTQELPSHTERIRSVEFIARLTYCTGLSILFFFWATTAPQAALEASLSTMNGLLKSVNHNIGGEVSKFLQYQRFSSDWDEFRFGFIWPIPGFGVKKKGAAGTVLCESRLCCFRLSLPGRTVEKTCSLLPASLF